MAQAHSAAADLYDEFGSGADNPNAEETFSPQSIGHGAVSRADERSTLAERLRRLIEIDPSTGCWSWQLSKNPKGYGLIQHQGRTRRAHRVSYETFVGPIPGGLHLDHLCRVRHCINPEHLEPVTLAENNRRGMSPGMVVNRTGICQRGHVIAGHNAKRRADGYVQCRECLNAATRRRYQVRKRAAKGALAQPN